MDLRGQRDAAAARYRATAAEREEIEQRQQTDGVPVVDTPEQIQARAARLLRTVESVEVLAAAPAMAAAAAETPAERHLALERIIAAVNDLQPVAFLPIGARAARTVARISQDRGGGRHIPMGTGFLVSPRLLLTNNHVLPNPAAAAQALAEFSFEADLDGITSTTVVYRLDPETLFLTDQHLDYSLVAVQPRADGRAPGEDFGWNRLVLQQGKIVTGEPVNIVGHPMGRPKEIAIRNNSLGVQLDEFLQYATDTEPGNSGSPVFNDQWEVVALHHAGVPRTDGDGNWLKADGTRWRPEDGEDAVEWVANEGIRVSVLLRHLAGAALTEPQRALLAEMGPQALPTATVAVGPVAALPTASVAPAAQPTPAAVPAEAATALARAAGLPARRPPRDDGTHLLFLHGRGQEGKDPEALRAKWAAGLDRGLLLAGLPAVEPADAWFPFYGDALAAALEVRESLPLGDTAPTAGAAAALAPREEPALAVYESLLEEAAARAGMPAEAAAEAPESLLSGLSGLVSRVQPQLTWLANRSGLDEALIAAVFHDVAVYLGRDQIRKVVLDTVLETVPASGRLVLISHSLGTVVAMDLLTQLPDTLEVVELVTAGSPLGMDTVFNRLLSHGPRRPERVGSWLNAWCPADAVAIGCPLHTRWGDGLTEVITNNPKERAHSIEEYLADPRVAAPIGAAL
jgi:endonuclease G, mitochondrial